MELTNKEKKFYKKYGVDLEHVKRCKERSKTNLYLNYLLSKNWAFETLFTEKEKQRILNQYGDINDNEITRASAREKELYGK